MFTELPAALAHILPYIGQIDCGNRSQDDGVQTIPRFFGRPDMTDNSISKVSYLVAGFGVGSLIAMLFAPKSGDETREYLANKAKAGRGYAEKRARDLKNRAEDLVERGVEAVAATKDRIATAVNVGRDVYRYECEIARKI
jgi:gas vesicle protein